MPFVDSRVKLNARIGAGPRGVTDLLPQLGGGNCPHRLTVDATNQVPLPTVFETFEKFVGDAHGVVGVLTGNCQVCLTVPIGVEFDEINLVDSLPGQFHYLDYVGLGHAQTAGSPEDGLETFVLFRVGLDHLLAVAAGYFGGVENLL